MLVNTARQNGVIFIMKQNGYFLPAMSAA